MPWSPEMCKSYFAGLSGIMYVLPAFYTPVLIEKVLWVSTAGISCLADYVYIGYKHPIQGFDQVLATFMLIKQTVNISLAKSPYVAAIYLIAPVSCYGLATYGKKRNKLNVWKTWHFLWHFIGSILCAVSTYQLYN